MATIPMTFVLRSQALVRTGGPVVMPRTDAVIPGSTVRGVLAQLVHQLPREDRAVALEDWIVTGRLQVSPAFPTTTDGRTAMPVPKSAVQQALGDEIRVRDLRAMGPSTDYRQQRGLFVVTPGEATPVVPRTETATRLATHRRRGAVEGMGPFSAEVLAPDQRFTAFLEWDGEYDELAEPLGRAICRLGDDARLGSAAFTGFGGSARLGLEPELSDGLPSHFPDVLRHVDAGEDLTAMVCSAALVRGTEGSHDPRSVDKHLERLLIDCWGVHAVSVRLDALGTRRVGGAHRGYGSMRPAYDAASEGTVLTVTAPRDLSVTDIVNACRQRLGERTVDGWGLWTFIPFNRESDLARLDAAVCDVDWNLTNGGSAEEADAKALSLLHDMHFQEHDRANAMTILAHRIAQSARPLKGQSWPSLRAIRRVIDVLEAYPDDEDALRSAADLATLAEGGLDIALGGVQLETGRLNRVAKWLDKIADSGNVTAEVVPTKIGGITVAAELAELTRTDVVALASDVLKRVGVRIQFEVGEVVE